MITSVTTMSTRPGRAERRQVHGQSHPAGSTGVGCPQAHAGFVQDTCGSVRLVADGAGCWFRMSRELATMRRSTVSLRKACLIQDLSAVVEAKHSRGYE